MAHRTRTGVQGASRQTRQIDHSHPTWLPPGRECPWCASRDTRFVQRGLAGGQESADQYIHCHNCGIRTYDIVAKNDRDIRINNYYSGGAYRDAAHQTRYTIYRMLKVGFNEFLLYLRPVLPDQNETQ